MNKISTRSPEAALAPSASTFTQPGPQRPTDRQICVFLLSALTYVPVLNICLNGPSSPHLGVGTAPTYSTTKGLHLDFFPKILFSPCSVPHFLPFLTELQAPGGGGHHRDLEGSQSSVGHHPDRFHSDRDGEEKVQVEQKRKKYNQLNTCGRSARTILKKHG